MELLNLDALANEVERSVKIGGQTYAIREQTVGMVINAIEVTQELAKRSKKGEAVDESMFIATTNAAKACVDAPASVVDSMSIAQLTALLEYANASDSEVVEGSGEEGSEEEGEGNV